MKFNMGTEIRTFKTLKDISEYVLDHEIEQKALYEDYSQWLGSLLRTCEEEHKDESWYQNSAALQKSLGGQTKKAPEKKAGGKKGSGKDKNGESSCWVQSGNALVSSTEQGKVELLFDAIEKISAKIMELNQFKSTIQQLERIGLGKNVTYIVYIEEEIPKKIVISSKCKQSEDEGFKFSMGLSVPAALDDSVNL